MKFTPSVTQGIPSTVSLWNMGSAFTFSHSHIVSNDFFLAGYFSALSKEGLIYMRGDHSQFNYIAQIETGYHIRKVSWKWGEALILS